MANKSKYQILIVGAGTAGVSVAARLFQDYPEQNWDIAIVDPSDKHYYQPLWTLVGAGVFQKEASERNQKDVLPPKAEWIQDSISQFEPEENQVLLSDGSKIKYDCLVVAAGIQINWSAIKGLPETLGKNGVCSNYSFEHVHKTWEYLKTLKTGRAIFTQPAMPIKCAGAPQKIYYLAEDYLRMQGLRDKIELDFCLAGPRIFGVEKYRNALEKVLERKNLHPSYEHNLIEIDGSNKRAIFDHNGQRVEKEFEMIHVVPPMSAPDFIAKSPLADEAGWVDVDMYTTQHKKFSNIFSLGDCSSLPTSRTGAAIRKQAPVTTKNIVSFFAQQELEAKYDGYASCPLVTGYGSCILAEFDYEGNPAESFPFDQAQERFSMYMLKAYGLPKLYWHGMLKGKA
ncbi:MAG: FAD/NAD(P)-binding oxidoreductase [Bacteriovoracaceae bacterium]|jgi:sulfide:quinone oxidoreductase|nr:FAD/NAD(P)-binding oxidoreductase [Bacteriovoracaceae bacterium]